MARLDDGFTTRIKFTGIDGLGDMFTLFWEKEVTPPGMSGGGANDTSTMHNTTWRTMSPKALVTLSESSFTAAYDPAVLDEIIAGLNVNQLIEITFSDGQVWTFWGWLDEFTPGASAEGSQPTADCTIIPSNQNDSGVETAPVLS